MTYTPASPPNFSSAGVLIAAHGSPNSPGGPSATRHHAEHLANMEIFAEVSAGFMAEKPFVSDVLDDLESSEIYIVPNLATMGYIYQEKLPKALGLTGQVTERITPKGHQRLILTEPVGSHPLIVKMMTSSIEATLKAFAIDTDDTALVIVGHGSTKSRASFQQTEKIASEIAQFGLADIAGHKAIFKAFLEEVPFVEDWRMQTEAQNVIFAPFLISDGFHANRDIPLAIGFDPGDLDFQANLAQGKASETMFNGQRLIYLPPLGSHPDVAEIIFSRVKQAQENFANT